MTDIWLSVDPPAKATSSQPITTDVDDKDRLFEEFKAGVARVISATDAESHVHLAEAYWEMGLCLDARREAAIALDVATAIDTAGVALRLLLTPPLLKPEGIERLCKRPRTN